MHEHMPAAVYSKGKLHRDKGDVQVSLSVAEMAAM